MVHLQQTAERIQLTVPADRRLLPVIPELVGLLPWGGLRRGSTLRVVGSTSLTLALVAAAVAQGSWIAVVGVPALGVAAAAETGIPLERLILVPRPAPGTSAPQRRQDHSGPQRRPGWPGVVAALLDGIDIVVVQPPPSVRGTWFRRLSARVRERSAVLVAMGEQPWEGEDLLLQITAGRWEGLGAGDGHLRARLVEVRAEGRGTATRPRVAHLWLPAPGGGDHAVDIEPSHLASSHWRVTSA